MSHLGTTKLSWWPPCQPLWGRENNGVSISRVLVARTLEISQSIYQDMWRLRSLQRGSPWAIRPSPPAPNSKSTLGLPLHGLYKRPPSCRLPWHGASGSLCPMFQNHFGRRRQTFFLKMLFYYTTYPRITSNRGSQIISHFWRRLVQTFGISVNLSTTYHPQTNGQTEEVN